MTPGALLTATNNASPEMNGSTVANSDDGSSSSMWARTQMYIQNNTDQNVFMQELLMRYDYLTQEYNTLVQNQQSNSQGLVDWKAEKQRYIDTINTMRLSLEQNPYVLILIDGDGMIFTDDFFRAGEAGGREAANKLHSVVSSHIRHELLDVPIDSEIVCVVYANVKGLADVLVRTGVVDEVSVVEAFVRGFTRGQTTFDFIDVGPGKDRADEKLIRAFKRNMAIYQCRKIYFGCSHDNGYARVLEDHATNPVYMQKLFLLEGVPFEKELLALPFSTTKFPGLFREKKISVFSAPPPSNTNAVNMFTPSNPCGMLSGMPGRYSSAPFRHDSRNSPFDSPIQVNATLAGMPRSSSVSTLASNDGVPLISWAAKAAAAPPVCSETPSYQPTNREEVIARNRLGQRVDPPCRNYDKAEVDRIKKIKMCNVHFLRHECPFGDNCTHKHDYRPTNAEIATLRLVARMAPCQNGSSCKDIKCIYGHRCPAPEARDAVKGTKTCIFGESCKFPVELHNVDSNVVKTLVVR